ncbi:hypothetical protein GX441_00900 [bacterium]|nr:hypothetical protein [bacterium]
MNTREVNGKPTLIILWLIVFFSLNCAKNPTSIRFQNSRFLPDSEYLYYGETFRVESPTNFNVKNPHHVAQYSVCMCINGYTNQLLQEITHVERDTEMGNAYVSFVREIGPDLEIYKGVPLLLKFEAYADYRNTEDISVWYYYLVDEAGNCLTRKPWVSLHLSRINGNCALTGIFVNLPDEDLMDIPEGLQRE